MRVEQPLVPSIKGYLHRLIPPEDRRLLPLIKTTDYAETLIVFHLAHISHFHGVVKNLYN